MAAIIDQLNFWDLHCLQFLLSLPIDDMQLLCTVQEYNCAWVYPLQSKHTTKVRCTPRHHSGQEGLAAQSRYTEDLTHLITWWLHNHSSVHYPGNGPENRRYTTAQWVWQCWNSTLTACKKANKIFSKYITGYIGFDNVFSKVLWHKWLK